MMEEKEKGLLDVLDEVGVHNNAAINGGGDEKDGIGYRAKICEALSTRMLNGLALSTFATGGQIDANESGLPTVVVNSVGRLSYPLCKQQAAALVGIATQAPFEKGADTIADVEVQSRAWQIEANLVTIDQKWMDTSLPQIVSECCVELGVDAAKMKVSAHLYKLLLYEEGGHFKKHKDTEKEPGMFGSLLIQLPAEHEGGALVVQHDGVTKRFEFAKDSADKAYYSSFYSDCDHVLEPVTSGLRLVLAFNLVHSVDAAPEVPVSAAVSALHRKGFECKLASLVKAWCEDPEIVYKFVYPLSRKYTPKGVSFGGMKGNDRKVLNLLQNAVDPTTGEKLFSVYIALVNKHVTGLRDKYEKLSFRYAGGRRRSRMCTCSADASLEYETDSWVGPDGPIDLGMLEIDFYTEIITAEEQETGSGVDEVCLDFFGDNPDKEEEEENYDEEVVLHFWYYSALVVFWPAQRDFEVTASNPALAIAVLTTMDRTSLEFAEKLQNLIDIFVRRRCGNFSVKSLLPLVQNIQQAQAVLGLSAEMSLTTDDCVAVANAAGRYSLQALAKEFLDLLSYQRISTVMYILELVKEHCPLEEQQGEASTPSVSWHALVHVLVKKVLCSPKCSFSESGVWPWESICQLAIANCNNHTLLKFAIFLGSAMTLFDLNLLVQAMEPHAATSAACGLFVRQLQVSACASIQQRKAPSIYEMIYLVDWIVKGGHADLMATLKPKLLEWCDRRELSLQLFAIPSVVAELKRDSPISADLASLVQVRIDKLVLMPTPDDFTWCMSLGTDSIPRDDMITEFLTGPDRLLTVTGFNGINDARRFAFQCRGLSMVATPRGRGTNAIVTMTKFQTYYKEFMKNCADSANELHNLRQLIRSRAHPSSAESTEVQQAQKKQRVGDLDPSTAESKNAEDEMVAAIAKSTPSS